MSTKPGVTSAPSASMMRVAVSHCNIGAACGRTGAIEQSAAANDEIELRHGAPTVGRSRCVCCKLAPTRIWQPMWPVSVANRLPDHMGPMRITMRAIVICC